MSKNFRLLIVPAILAFVAVSGAAIASTQATASQATRKALVKSIDDVLAVKNAPPGISVQVTGNGRTQYFGRGKGNLASGAALMLALRAALIGTAWPGIAVWLAAALAAHLAEMVIRFRRDGAVASPDCDKLARNNQKWRTFGARPPMT